MSKIVVYWIKNCASIQFLLLRITCGEIFYKVLKNPLLLLPAICLDMFQGEGLISILKIWVKNVFDSMLNILCVLFIKHFMMNV